MQRETRQERKWIGRLSPAAVTTVAAAALLSLLALVSLAHAGLSQKGNLQVSFNGGFRPSTLPRTSPPRSRWK